MHHFMREGVLEVLAVANLVGAEQDAVAGAEAAGLAMDLTVVLEAGGAATAHDIGRVETAVEVGDLALEEADDGRVAKEPVAMVLAALAVALLVDLVAPFTIVELALGRDLAGEDAEVVHPPFGLRIEAGAGGIVDDFLWGRCCCCWAGGHGGRGSS